MNSSKQLLLLIRDCFGPSLFDITTCSLFLYLEVGGGMSCPNSTVGVSPIISLLGDLASGPSFEGLLLESTSLRVIAFYFHEGFRQQSLTVLVFECFNIFNDRWGFQPQGFFFNFAQHLVPSLFPQNTDLSSKFSRLYWLTFFPNITYFF